MRIVASLTLILGGLLNSGCVTLGPTTPLAVVDDVDVERYMGK